MEKSGQVRHMQLRQAQDFAGCSQGNEQNLPSGHWLMRERHQGRGGGKRKGKHSNVMQTEHRLEGNSRMVEPKAERKKCTPQSHPKGKYLTRPSMLLCGRPRLHSGREPRAGQGMHPERASLPFWHLRSWKPSTWSASKQPTVNRTLSLFAGGLYTVMSWTLLGFWETQPGFLFVHMKISCNEASLSILTLNIYWISHFCPK